jgi:tRNA modification GTPase
MSLAAGKDILLAGNKLDLVEREKLSICPDLMTSACIASVAISALTGENIESLTREIEDWVYKDAPDRDAPSLNMRQLALCLAAADCLEHVRVTLAAGMPQDCLASDLKIAIDALSEISGSAVSEQIITAVFANFCIGKSDGLIAVRRKSLSKQAGI